MAHASGWLKTRDIRTHRVKAWTNNLTWGVTAAKHIHQPPVITPRCLCVHFGKLPHKSERRTTMENTLKYPRNFSLAKGNSYFHYNTVRSIISFFAVLPLYTTSCLKSNNEYMWLKCTVSALIQVFFFTKVQDKLFIIIMSFLYTVPHF